MRRSRKILLAVGLVVIAVIAAGVALVLILPETDILRSRVREELKKHTGQEVLLGSMGMSLAFPDAVTLTLEGLSIQTAERKVLLSADRIVFSPALLPLLSGRVQVDSISIHRLRTSVVRDTDGTVRFPLIAAVEASKVPRSHAPAESPASAPGIPSENTPEHAAPIPQERPRPSAPAADVSQSVEGKSPDVRSQEPVAWSVATVKISDARIDWTDFHARPDEPIRMALEKVGGEIRRRKTGRVYDAALDATAALAEGPASPFKLRAEFTPAADFSRIESAKARIESQQFDPAVFKPYVPEEAAPLLKLGRGTVEIAGEMIPDRLSPVSFSMSLGDKTQGSGTLDVRGSVRPAEGFSAVRQVQCSVETDGLPISILRAHIPPTVPIKRDKGVVKAELSGTWAPPQEWFAEGTVTVDEVEPTGKLTVVGAPLRIFGAVSAGPSLVAVKSFDVSAGRRLLGVDGAVNDPFSDSPEFDMNAKLIVDPVWARALGVDLPKDLVVSGAVPFTGRVRGRPDNFWYDFVGDLKAARIAWRPYLEKRGGAGGSLAIKGEYRPDGGKYRGAPKLIAAIRMDMSGAELRVKPGDALLERAFVNLSGDVSSVGRPLGKTVNIRDIGISIRSGSHGKEILAVQGAVEDVLSSRPRIKGDGRAGFDAAILPKLGVALPPELKIGGAAPLKVSFSGRPASLNWWLDLPLTHLDVTYTDAFRKPGGIAGSLRGAGTWNPKALELRKGTLTLPGLALAFRGRLLDSSGAFGGLTVDIRKGELRSMTRLVPAIQGVDLSGPIEGTVRLHPPGPEKPIVPEGTFTLADVDVTPPAGGEIGAHGLRGVIDFKGDSVVIPEVTGRLSGKLEAPVKVNGVVKRIGSLKAMQGDLSIKIGKGQVRADWLKRWLDKSRLLLTALFGVGRNVRGLLDLEYLTADVSIADGSARTNNLKIKGPRISSGAIGSLGLDSMRLSLLLGIHTVVEAGDALGKVPAVEEFVKKHQKVIEATGLDKALKTFGIRLPGAKKSGEDSGRVVKTPVTVILRLAGPASNPEVTPVLEQSLDPETAGRLKSLME